MTKRSVRRPLRSIDPKFFIPEGVDELYYQDYDATQEGQLGEDDFTIGEFILDEPPGDDDDDHSEAPGTPTIIGIVPPQIVRTTDAGNQVVDVVIEVEDIEGLEYEIRVSPLA